MKRTKLRERILPDYTHGEELVNMISHIVGGALGIVVLVLSVVFSALRHNAWAVVASAIYGTTFIMLYTVSSVYHGLRAGTGKKVMQVIDHCTIYFYIAGSYTPILLVALRPVYPHWAWTLFGIVWGLTALATALTAVDLKKFSIFSMICYISMGWCIVMAIKPLLTVMAPAGLALLVSGGVAYTAGAVVYGLGKKHRYMHSVFHMFVLLGSILHAICILFYVL